MFDLANFGPETGRAAIAAWKSGLGCGDAAGGSRIEMRFDHPMAAIYFERGQKSEVRAFFYKDDIPQGHRHYLATLNISGDIVAESDHIGEIRIWTTPLPGPPESLDSDNSAG